LEDSLSCAAKGESELFLGIHEKQVRAPEVTKQYMFLRMAEQVLPRMKVLVLATDARGNPIKVQLVRRVLPTLPQLSPAREAPRRTVPAPTPEPDEISPSFIQRDVLSDSCEPLNCTKAVEKPA
jgi:hypothetical protein